MRPFLPAAIAASMVAVASIGAIASMPRSQAVDEVTTASIPKPQKMTFMMSDGRTGNVCVGVRGERVGDKAFDLALEPACEAVQRGLSQAVAWIERERGVVAFVRENGLPVVKAGPSDGAMYEVFSPRSALITISRID